MWAAQSLARGASSAQQRHHSSGSVLEYLKDHLRLRGVKLVSWRRLQMVSQQVAVLRCVYGWVDASSLAS